MTSSRLIQGVCSTSSPRQMLARLAFQFEYDDKTVLAYIVSNSILHHTTSYNKLLLTSAKLLTSGKHQL